MVQGPSWETNRFSARQEFPLVLWNSKVHYRIHKSRPPALTLSKHSPIQRIIYETVEIAYKPVNMWSRYLANPGRGKRHFSLLQNVQAGSGVGPAPCSFSAGVSFSRVKRSGRDAHPLSVSAAEVKNEWSYTSSSSVRLHGAGRGNFTSSTYPNIFKASITTLKSSWYLSAVGYREGVCVLCFCGENGRPTFALLATTVGCLS
jgi:hypothetical protein